MKKDARRFPPRTAHQAMAPRRDWARMAVPPTKRTCRTTVKGIKSASTLGVRSAARTMAVVPMPTRKNTAPWRRE